MVVQWGTRASAQLGFWAFEKKRINMLESTTMLESQDSQLTSLK